MEEEEFKVISSYDYFSKIKGNRDTSEKHIMELAESIRKYGQCKEVDCAETSDGTVYIIDGQHTARACLLVLNIPVKIILRKGLTEEEIRNRMRLCNSLSKSWKNSDFENDFVSEGNSNYIALQNTLDKYSYLTRKVICTIVTDTSYLTFCKNFTEGTLKFEVSPKNEQLLEEANFLVDLVKLHRIEANEKFTLSVYSTIIAEMLYKQKYDSNLLEEIIREDAEKLPNDIPSCRQVIRVLYEKKKNNKNDFF